MSVHHLSRRLETLEAVKAAPRARYVVHMSNPPLSDEIAALAQAKAEGRYVAVVPHVCATTEEWQALFAPTGTGGP